MYIYVFKTSPGQDGPDDDHAAAMDQDCCLLITWPLSLQLHDWWQDEHQEQPEHFGKTRVAQLQIDWVATPNYMSPVRCTHTPRKAWKNGVAMMICPPRSVNVLRSGRALA